MMLCAAICFGAAFGWLGAHWRLLTFMYAKKHRHGGPVMMAGGQRSSVIDELGPVTNGALTAALLMKTAESAAKALDDASEFIDRGDYDLWCEYRVAVFKRPATKAR